MHGMRVVSVSLLALMLLVAGAAAGQGFGQNQILGLWLPNASQGAVVGQTVGVTNIEVIYHRPVANEREIWGALVPFDQVWRTGANENTLIVFSTDVKVEGEPLVAGTYGLHTIPGADEWQVIFSNDTTAWGSFSYDEANDALRVTVKPEPAEYVEQMLFTFDDVTGDSATLAMRWAKLRVPIAISVDTEQLALASIRDQLKGLGQFGWQAWNQAANYCLQNEINLEEALTWAESSITAEERFDNLSTKAQILAALDRQEESDEVMEQALKLANAGQLHNYGRQLLGQGKNDEAMAVFQRNATDNPDTWFIGVGLARGYAAMGEFDKAVEAMKDALAKAPENQKAYIQGLVEQLQNKQNI